MPFVIYDHEASAKEALAWGLLEGDIKVIAEVPEPAQSAQHQARVGALTIRRALEVGADFTQELDHWAPDKWPQP